MKIFAIKRPLKILIRKKKEKKRNKFAGEKRKIGKKTKKTSEQPPKATKPPKPKEPPATPTSGDKTTTPVDESYKLDYSTISEDAKPKLEELKHLLEVKHAEVFSKNDRDWGMTDIVEHKANIIIGTIPLQVSGLFFC